MKTYELELQRLHAARHEHGMIELQLDMLVSSRPAHSQAQHSSLRLSLQDARTLALLLKQQLDERDKLQPRSRRSGRA